MQYIILDLEATCWQGYTPEWRQEVIEIGAQKIDPFGEISSQFHQMVKPTERPQLSSFCMELTGITQDEIANAKHFPSVAEAFFEWVGEEPDNIVICAWGHKDKLILEEECRFHGMATDWLKNYVDLKKQYHQIKDLSAKQGLVKTLDKEGMPFEGEHHRAMSDAENLGRLFVKYIDEWQY